MKFPDEFEYTDKTDLKTYTNTPQKIISIPRLIQNKPYWEQMTSSSQRAKKTLIVTDWTAVAWNENKILIEIQLVLADLLKEGFIIYLWQAGSLYPLCNVELLSSESILEDITPEFPQKIIQTAVEQLQLAADKIHLLDDYQLASLIAASPIEKRSISYKALTMWSAKQDAMKKINSLLNTSKPKIELVDEQDTQGLLDQDLNIAFKPNLQSHSVKCVKMESMPSRNDFLLMLLTVECLDIRSNTMITDALIIPEMLGKQLKRLSLRYMTLTGDMLSRILKFENLQYLELDHVVVQGRILASSSSLTALVMNGVNMNNNTVNEILSIAPHLSHLELKRSSAQTDWSFDSQALLSLGKLHTLLLAGFNFNMAVLFKLLKHTPKLVSLTVKTSDMNKALPAETIQLPELRTFSFDGESLVHWFNAELFHAPKLCKLILSICDIDRYQSVPRFNQLKSLTIEKLYCYDGWLDSLLQYTKRLESIIFNDAGWENGLNRPLLLPCVNNLIIHDTSGYTCDSLVELIQALPALTHLTLDNTCMKSSEYGKKQYQQMWDFLNVLNYSRLIYIYLDNTRIDTDSLIKLLRKLGQEAVNLVQFDYSEPEKKHYPHNDLICLAEALGTRLTGRIEYARLNNDSNNNMSSMILKHVVMDANTAQNTDIKHSVNKIFYSTQGKKDPAVSSYRKHVFDQLIVIEKPESINNAFELKNTLHDTLIPLDKNPEVNDVFAMAATSATPCWYGKQSFYLDHAWQALSSLSATETLLHYHVYPDTPVDISYSKHDNLYYIRARDPANTGMSVTVDFLITVQTAQELPLVLHNIVNKLRQFGEGALSLNKDILSGTDLLNAIKDQRVGSCRHRAMLMKSMMDIKNIPARIVLNDCHAFVEVQFNGEWLTCNLSGYPIKHLVVNEPQKPTLLAQTPVSARQLTFQRDLATYRPAETGECYFQTLLNGVHQNKLIYIESSAILQFSLMIQAEALKLNYRIFCINSPDDVSCYAGGTLYDLITTPSDRPLVLIYNFDRLPAENIVSGNSSFEANPHIDGIPLPPYTRIIGLIDPDKPGSYNGNDLSSRFSGRIDRYSSSHVPVLMPVLFPVMNNTVADRYVINFSHSSAWLTQLLGGPVIRNNERCFEPGELIAALASCKPIELLNPPKDDLFDYFWQEARLRKQIVYQGLVIPLPDHVELYYSHGYRWKNVSVIRRAISDNAHVLNPGVLSRFLSDYQCVDGILNYTNGILDRGYSKGDTVELLMTRQLNQDEMDRLMTHCERRQLSLAFDGWTAFLKTLKQNKNTRCIETQDSDAILASKKYSSIPHIVIDCSECAASDLLDRIDIQVLSYSPTLQLQCNNKESVLTRSLNAGKHVILTGSFSDELRDELAPFLIKRLRQENAPGQLIILTNKPFNYLPMESLELSYLDKKHALSPWFGDKQHNLKRLISEKQGYLLLLPFTQLRAKLMYLNANSYVSTSKGTWQGFETVPLNTLQQQSPFDDNISEKEAEEFEMRRYYAINAAFFYTPYVFIAGLTGVGKSHFVYHTLAKNPSYQNNVFWGADTMTRRAWAEARTTNASFLVLFIDEANLAACEWSEFEGLFCLFPGILIDGNYYPLTRNHRVLFAGNPLSYGDTRHVASLFKRHGHAVMFDPLPLSVIYQSCIKPLLLQLPSYRNKTTIINALLDRYQFFVSIAQDDVLITPRQIQMILLLFLAFEKNHPQATEEQCHKMLCLYAHQLLAPLVPKAHEITFNRRFPVIERPELAQIAFPFKGPSGHYYMPSRYSATYQLLDFLQLRSTVIDCGLQDSGLRRVIIEGESGLGKSGWLRDILVWCQLSYYNLPTSVSSDERRRILLSAFDEGAIVIVDEINSISSMEELMNSLLDGKHPNEQGRGPHRTGFRIIGTQNSASLSGRGLTSPALLNRTLTIHLQPYTRDEMVMILSNMGLSQQSSQEMVAAYEHNVNEARRENLHPIPVFRNLIDLALTCIQSENKRQAEDRVTPVSGLNFTFLSSKKARTTTSSAPDVYSLGEDFSLSGELNDWNSTSP